MASKLTVVLPAVMVSLIAGAVGGQDFDLDEENMCIACHGNSDLWDEDTKNLHVTPADLANDIHWQKGIKCNDCHGGNAETFDLREAHAIEDGFRPIESPMDVADFCGHCHSDAQYMQKFDPDAATDQVERFWSGVHGRHLKETGGEDAATCLSCHPVHQMRAVQDPDAGVNARNLVETCGNCHTQVRTELRKSVHHAAGHRDLFDRGTPLDCAACHGTDAHGMGPVEDPDSPMYLDHQVQVCGACHQEYLASYEASVHGVGLRESGLLVTAVCSDCHGGHAIYYAADQRSTLHATVVADTCGQCHAFLKQRLEQSVHGMGGAADGAEEAGEPTGTAARRPSCVDCHQGHDQPDPHSVGFRRQTPHRCGNCHSDYAQRYGMSLHGELSRLGYEPAANCADCHGAHSILPASNPDSRLAGANRLQTCRECHPRAVAGFAGFDPHADPKDPVRYPWLYRISSATDVVVYVLFGLFAVHAFFWFFRSLVQTLEHGRDPRLPAGQPAVARHAPLQRRCYWLLIIAFVGLTLTGLPLKYSSYPWARRLAGTLGGFETTSVWHRFFALLVFVAAGLHVAWAIRRVISLRAAGLSWRHLLWGPDSPLPNGRDAGEIWRMIKWFFGLGRKPVFERWTYWEKFDYWAVYLAVILIGVSGLILWLPNLFTLVLPGQSLNVAKVIHADTALWVASLLFLIHFFNTHFRPEKFPMDLSLLTGLVSEEHLRNARPEFVERMQAEGRLEPLRTEAPPRSRLWLAMLSGYVVLGAGLILLTSVMLAFLGK
jgi:cytochrome b subunit of formate dehydrogenase